MSESKGSAQDRLEVSGGGRSIEKTFGSFSLCPSLVRVRNVSWKVWRKADNNSEVENERI